MTPGRKRALTVRIAKAQLNHLIYATTPEGGETRQQRRVRERNAAKLIRKMQKDEFRNGGKEKDGSEAEEKIAGASVIKAQGQESDQG